MMQMSRITCAIACLFLGATSAPAMALGDADAYRDAAAVAKGLDELVLASWASPSGGRANDPLKLGLARFDAALARNATIDARVAESLVEAKRRIAALEALRPDAIAVTAALAALDEPVQHIRVAAEQASGALARSAEHPGAEAAPIARQLHGVGQIAGVVDLVLRDAQRISSADPMIEYAAEALPRHLGFLDANFAGLRDGDARLGIPRIDDEPARAALARAAEAYATMRPQVEALVARAGAIAPFRERIEAVFEALRELDFALERAADDADR